MAVVNVCGAADVILWAGVENQPTVSEFWEAFWNDSGWGIYNRGKWFALEPRSASVNRPVEQAGAEMEPLSLLENLEQTKFKHFIIQGRSRWSCCTIFLYFSDKLDFGN